MLGRAAVMGHHGLMAHGLVHDCVGGCEPIGVYGGRVHRQLGRSLRAARSGVDDLVAFERHFTGLFHVLWLGYGPVLVLKNQPVSSNFNTHGVRFEEVFEPLPNFLIKKIIFF